MSDPYNPESQVGDFYIPPETWDQIPDLAYFRQKAERATSPEAARKYRRQLELLEDAVVIYHCGHPPRETPLVIHSEFLSEQINVRNFLKKLLDF